MTATSGPSREHHRALLPEPPGLPARVEFLFAPGSNVPQPIPGNTTDAAFTCRIPTAALTGGPAAKPTLYGHGLLGSAGEVGSGPQSAMVREHNYLYCATDWAGFSTTDVATVAASLQDLSNFPKLVDRMQQGFVNFMYLGRALVRPDGLAGEPEFQRPTATRRSTTRASTTTATARAGSWAGRSPRSPPTSTAPCSASRG